MNMNPVDLPATTFGRYRFDRPFAAHGMMVLGRRSNSNGLDLSGVKVGRVASGCVGRDVPVVGQADDAGGHGVMPENKPDPGRVTWLVTLIRKVLDSFTRFRRSLHSGSKNVRSSPVGIWERIDFFVVQH